MRYSQEPGPSSIVDINQQSTLLSSIYSNPTVSTGAGYTTDTSAFYQQNTHNYPVYDSRPRLTSQSPVTTNLSSNFRGPVALHPPVVHMTTREKYSSATPKFGRQSEVRASNWNETVMQQGDAYRSAGPLPSYNSAHDAQDGHSPPYARPSEEVSLPMEETESLGTLQYLDTTGNTSGPPVEATISANIHQNFFMGDKYYTCYRRNYMACTCSFSLSPLYSGVPLQFTPHGGSAPLTIFGFAMCLSAVVSSNQHQEVKILQHTPKRDKGPIAVPQKSALAPKPRASSGTPPHMGSFADAGPSRALFTADGYGLNGIHTLPTEHSFTRIQFKTATANNGERRAGQQCYRLVVELWADIGAQTGERWMKVAIQKSAEVVVRGRSPGHYQRERRKSQGSGGGPSPHGNYEGGTGGMGDYDGAGGMLSGQSSSSYGTQGSYEQQQQQHQQQQHQQQQQQQQRGGMYGGGELARRDVAYSLESKAFDGRGLFPSNYTHGAGYSDAGFYHQNAQAAGVSPLDVYGKPRSDPEMIVLPQPRPAEPPLRTGPDGRCLTTSNPYPLPSLGTGSYVSS